MCSFTPTGRGRRLKPVVVSVRIREGTPFKSRRSAEELTRMPVTHEIAGSSPVAVAIFYLGDFMFEGKRLSNTNIG